MLSTKGAMSFGFGIKNIKVCKSTPQLPLNKLLHSVLCSGMSINFTALGHSGVHWFTVMVALPD